MPEPVPFAGYQRTVELAKPASCLLSIQPGEAAYHPVAQLMILTFRCCWSSPQETHAENVVVNRAEPAGSDSSVYLEKSNERVLTGAVAMLRSTVRWDAS